MSRVFSRLFVPCVLALTFPLQAQPRFDPIALQNLVKTSLEERKDKNWTLQRQLDFIYSALQEEHPGRINKKPTWIFNQAAGALGQLQILYCSPTEYLIFFGSSVGTEGHSGRYEMEVWDTMLEGEMWAALQGELQKSVYRDGDLAHLPKGKAKAYKIPEFGYMLEYGRGQVAKALAQGVLMPAFFINQDFASMKEQLGECAGLAIKGFFTK